MPPVPDGACEHQYRGDDPANKRANARPFRGRAPRYPKRALSQGIQGWACVGFTIAVDGTVEHPVIVASAPEGYFEESALTAVRTWSYLPHVVGGKPVERTGVQILLKFAIEWR